MARPPKPAQTSLANPEEFVLKPTQSWKELSALMKAAGEAEVVAPNPTGHISYHEQRAIRFAYCVLGWNTMKICKAMGRHYQSVNNIVVRKRLKHLRAKIDTGVIKKAVQGMEGQVEEVTALTVVALKRYLTEAIKNETPLTPKDAKLISDIGANFHRILQLIKGRPTGITQNLNEMTEEMSIKVLVETLKLMKEDPMFNMDKFLAEVGVSKEEAEKAIEAPADFDA